jgi:outer membrane lipoprotein-sorting protein
MTQTFRALLVVAVLGPALLALGCGANPAATKRVKKKTPAPAMQQLQGAQLSGAPAGAGGPIDPQVAQMLDSLRKAQASVPGFTATIETFDKGPAGQESNTLKVAYKKPSSLRIEMIKASGQAQGAKILWTGGNELKIKPAFLPMSVTKPVNDDSAKSKNGWTIRETEVNAIFKVIFDPGARIVAKGMQPIDNKPLAVFELVSPSSPKGVTNEVVGIDPATGLPGVRMLFKGQTLIYKLTIKNMQIKAVSASEMNV